MTNEYENTDGVTRAATEVIDGVTYEVVYFNGDYDSNKTKLAVKGSNGNYRYVLTADFDMSFDATHRDRRIDFYGNAVILDLNGHVLTANGWAFGDGNGMDYWSYLVLRCTKFELTDSSAAQSGRLVGKGRWQNVATLNCKNIVISGGGGFLSLSTSAQDAGNVTFTGGVYDTLNFSGFDMDENLSVAPYLDATYDAAGQLVSVSPYDTYAVSTTDLVAGAYNYAYGLAWEINITALKNLAVPADKTYYLWARNDGDAWYRSLNSIYADGAWQNAV